MNPETEIPARETIEALLQHIVPGSHVLEIASLPGSYSNYTHLVGARAANGSGFRVVVRRYKVFGSYDRGEKARREFKSFEILQRNGIPSPRPLYLDDEGAVLGTPGIVTSYVQGTHVTSPSEPVGWAETLAVMLAKIHAIPCVATDRDFLLDADAEATWFLRSGSVPDYMQAHPDGAAVWHLVRALAAKRSPVHPTLVHIDYWPGNILWHQGQITAVLDWEEAAYGDPAIDVAYCRMEMCLSGMSDVADAFLNAYERAAGQTVANLAFWELAAAARPMFSPEGWISASPAREAFRSFIATAKERACV